MQEFGSPVPAEGQGWGAAAPQKWIQTEPWGWYSVGSPLGSVLPSTLHGGLSPSSAQEPLPALAWGQTGVLHRVVALGHHPPSCRRGQTFPIQENFCLWPVRGNAEVKQPGHPEV